MTAGVPPTKERILHAACQQFARGGYHGTTVQDICSQAQANIAAVNYHFGSKDNLYGAVWQQLCSAAAARWEATINPAMSAQQQLCAYIALRVQVALDDGPTGWLAKVIHHEIGNPSPLQNHIWEHFLAPKRAWLHGVISSMLGIDAAAAQVQHVCLAIMSPLNHLQEFRERQHMHFNAADTVAESVCMPPPPLDPETLIATLQTLIVAGVQALRVQNQERSALCR